MEVYLKRKYLSVLICPGRNLEAEIMTNHWVISYIFSSRVLRTGKYIKKVLFPVNSHGFIMGKLCIVLFPSVENILKKNF